MTTDVFAAVLVFLGAIVSTVLFVTDRLGKRLAESIPPDVLTLMIGLLDLADRLADSTPTPDDDALVARLREALNRAPADPIDPNAAG